MKKANRKKMEEVLIEIEKNIEFDGPIHKQDGMLFPFEGTVDNNVRFLGEYFEWDCCSSINRTEIDLYDHNIKICHISKLNGLMSKQESDANSLNPFGSQINEFTDILVSSPDWDPTNGLRTAIEGLVKRLSVYHSQRESADAVVNRVYNAVARSKNKTVNTKKLSRLDLSNNSAAIVEAICDRLEQSQPATKPINTNHEREV